MASTNKTPNYALNQWVGIDPVLMEDFNADNAKIDEAISALGTRLDEVVSGSMKITMGSYAGSGGYGSDDPCSLKFDFMPILVIVQKAFKNITIAPTSLRAILIRPATKPGVDMYAGLSGDNTMDIDVEWSERGVKWWMNMSGSHTVYAPNWQLNTKDEIYHYIAIGV